jgi:hypothetical protein
LPDDELDNLLEAIGPVAPTKTLQWLDVREALFESLEEVASDLRSRRLVGHAARAGTNHLMLQVGRPRDDGAVEHLDLVTFDRTNAGLIQAISNPAVGAVARSLLNLDFASDRAKVRNLLAGWLGPILRA